MPEPEFEVVTHAGRQLVICTLGEHQGAARVFSAGLQDAKDRAEAQARSKAAESE